MEKLSAADIKRMFISAYLEVKGGRERINKINVFPVPDQDTGNNLTRTLKGMHDAISNHSYATVHDLRGDLLDGTLTNASGNVGIIMTSFINGFLAPMPRDNVTALHLETGMKEGSVQAYAAIQEPKKGTILDVIQASADSFTLTAPGEKDISICFERAITAAQKALKETTEKMEIYKKVSVVDAGAYGFTLFLEGLLKGLRNTELVIGEENQPVQKTKTFIQILSNRYEVVSLVGNPTKKRAEILALLSSLGDSIDIVEANGKVKIHIHTDYPDEVSDHISALGEVIQMRTYDMTRGPEEYGREGKSSIGLVVDGAASLSLPLAAELDAAIVNFQTNWEESEKHPQAQGKNVYEKMRIIRSTEAGYGWPRTSQPSPNEYRKAYLDQLKKYREVLCIALSSQVSGAYNSALQARKLLPPADQARVYIPDFRQGIGGQGILAIEANRLIGMGMDMEGIVRKLMQLAPEIRITGLVTTTEWLVEGGRIPRSLGKVMSFLQLFFIQPVFQIRRGRVGLKGFQFGRNILSRRLYHTLEKEASSRKLRLVINHADAPEEVARFKKLMNGIPHEILYEGVLPPVLGIHTGPDSLIISYY